MDTVRLFARQRKAASGTAAWPTGTGNAARAVSTKDEDEELARLVLASVLGVPVTVHDTRSGLSTYDLEVTRPDGKHGAAEVVSTRTPELAAQLSAVRRADYTADGGLRHLWIARVPPGAVISRVRPALRGCWPNWNRPV